MTPEELAAFKKFLFKGRRKELEERRLRLYRTLARQNPKLVDFLKPSEAPKWVHNHQHTVPVGPDPTLAQEEIAP